MPKVRKAIALFAIAITSQFSSVAPAMGQDDRMVYEPTSQWTLDFAEDSCALRRTFSRDGDEVFFELRGFAPNEIFRALILSQNIRFTDRSSTFAYEPVQGEQGKYPAAPVTVEGWQSGIYLRVPTPSLASDPSNTKVAKSPEVRSELERAITNIYIGNSYHSNVSLQTGRMDLAMEVMKACLDDLVSQWGLDPEIQNTLLRSAQPNNLRQTVNKFRYPAGMKVRNKQTVLFARVLVDAEGNVTDCRVLENISDEQFATAACQNLVSELQYDPALDREGNPVDSFHVPTIIFGLP